MKNQETLVDISITKAETSGITKIDFDNLVFGKHFSDHVFIVDYKDGEWHSPRIEPFGMMQVHPAMSCLHYGQTIFEGMKAYRTVDNEVVLFRPDKNAERMNVSAVRMCMAEIPEELFLAGVKSLIDIDRNWVSEKEGYSLYIRPFMFASEPVLGVRPSNEYRFMIFTSPVGSYYAGAVKVKVETNYTRVAKGGTGVAKTGGNYASALYPAKLSQDQGYNQNVWTDAAEHKYIEESGTMNIFFVVDGKLITPSLEDGTILNGITRDSIITLAKHLNIPLEERKVTVEEIKAAAENGTLTEAFGAGTAATIAPISLIHVLGTDYTLPELETRVISNQISKTLSDIRTGKSEDIFGWLTKI